MKKAYTGALLTLGLICLAPAQAATVYFNEDFDTLDSAVWAVSDNGVTDGVQLTGTGWVSLAAGNTLDAPYVHSASGVSLFPASGDFSVEIGFQYTSLAVNGVGLVMLDASAQAVAGFWADSGTGLNAYVGTSNVGLAGASSAGATAQHVIRWDFTGTNLTLYYDGVEAGSTTTALRPGALWFGHPSVGQQHSTDRAYSISSVDDGGIVLSRWWGTGDWTDLSVDYIRVETAVVPLPAAVWLFGSGLLGLAGIARYYAR